jgi:hypothetical protein
MFQKARFQTVFHPPGYPFSANPLIVPTQSFASGKEDTRNTSCLRNLHHAFPVRAFFGLDERE